MEVEVREVRVGEVEAAVAFARKAGSTVDAARVVPGMSLLAWDGDEPVAALLGLRTSDGTHEMELTFAEGAADELGRRLIDTALLKLRSRHIAKSRLRITGEQQAAALWSAVNWTPGKIPGKLPGKAA